MRPNRCRPSRTRWADLRFALLLGNADKAKRLEAARSLADSGTPATKLLLSERIKVESDAEVRTALRAALDQIDGRLAWGERLGVIFTGISLGSILLLVALGLAITYGLMGVINMAHGELMMIGAYATYVVQNLFRSLPARRLRLPMCWWRSRRRSWRRPRWARCWSAA